MFLLKHQIFGGQLPLHPLLFDHPQEDTEGVDLYKAESLMANCPMAIPQIYINKYVYIYIKNIYIYIYKYTYIYI